MKNNQYKQNPLYKKEERRLKRIDRMKPEQQDKYANNLINRSKRKSEIREKIIQILSSKEGLAIVDIQRELGLNRNTFNYWINMLEKEGWIKRKKLEAEGKNARGQPKTLILNKKRIKEREQYSSKHWKSFEDYNLKSIATEKILREIDEKQPLDSQHERLVELFKKFKQDSYGAKIIFLLYSDYIKVNYNFSLTEKGKRELEKIKKRKKPKKP